jgi:alpha/beta superfamily hydrolase
MNASTQRLTVQGPAGPLEVLVDQADATTLPPTGAKGVAVIAHPHPLFGGTMDNKVVQTLARAWVQAGWTAVRFNFRGVGQSAGTHDNGVGEVEDMAAVLEALAPKGPFALAGFSFGAFVTSQLVVQLWKGRGPQDLQKLVLVGTAASRFTVPILPPEVHPNTLVIHGETDDTVPLTAALDWARPQALPITVIPGVGHFFHGQLPLLKRVVMSHIRP